MRERERVHKTLWKHSSSKGSELLLSTRKQTLVAHPLHRDYLDLRRKLELFCTVESYSLPFVEHIKFLHE